MQVRLSFFLRNSLKEGLGADRRRKSEVSLLQRWTHFLPTLFTRVHRLKGFLDGLGEDVPTESVSDSFEFLEVPVQFRKTVLQLQASLLVVPLLESRELSMSDEDCNAAPHLRKSAGRCAHEIDCPIRSPVIIWARRRLLLHRGNCDGHSPPRRPQGVRSTHPHE